jgi:hypothetical protein
MLSLLQIDLIMYLDSGNILHRYYDKSRTPSTATHAVYVRV